MKNIYITILCCSFLALYACDDFLDIKPKGIQIPEYYDDYLRLLNHKNMMYADDSYLSYITDDILLVDEKLELGQFIQAQEHKQNLYAFANGPIYSSGMTDNLWEDAYKRIYTFNVIINNVPACSDAKESEKNELVAMARVNRAFEFLILVNVYGKHYDAATANTDLGIPIILSEDINSDYQRNTVAEVYEQIISDMNKAETYLKKNTSSPFKPTIQSLNALRAKVYFYMGDWENARNYALAATAPESHFIDLTTYAINPKANGMGRIFNPDTNKAFPDIYDNQESLFARCGKDYMSLSRNIYVSDDLLAVYEKDLPQNAVDKRKELFGSKDFFKLYNKVYEFPGKTMWVPYCNFNGGLSYPETTLILAESIVRLALRKGNELNADVEKALQLVDHLRNNRIVNNLPLKCTDARSALRVILDERRRELALSGSIRLIDLKRLNKEEAFRKNIVHTMGNQTWTLPANDPRYILPLPPKVLAENPSLPIYER